MMVEPAPALGVGALLDGPLANARLLASRQAPDIGGVPDVEKERKQQEEAREPPLPGQHEHPDACRARY